MKRSRSEAQRGFQNLADNADLQSSGQKRARVTMVEGKYLHVSKNEAIDSKENDRWRVNATTTVSKWDVARRPGTTPTVDPQKPAQKERVPLAPLSLIPNIFENVSAHPPIVLPQRPKTASTSTIQSIMPLQTQPFLLSKPPRTTSTQSTTPKALNVHSNSHLNTQLLLPLRDRAPESTNVRPHTEVVHKSKQLGNSIDYLPSARYLEWQPAFSGSMRTTLLDWMMEVCAEANFHRETFYYAATILDRLFTKVPKLGRDRFQLFGAGSLFIAAKIEEINAPDALWLINLTDNTYSVKELITVEKIILQKLRWYIPPETALHWLQRYCHLIPEREQPSSLTPQFDMTLFLPHISPDYLSIVASAATSTTTLETIVTTKTATETTTVTQTTVTCTTTNVPKSFALSLFTSCVQVLDVATLHLSSLQFAPNVLAAAVLMLAAGNTIPAEKTAACNKLMKAMEWVLPIFVKFYGPPTPVTPHPAGQHSKYGLWDRPLRQDVVYMPDEHAALIQHHSPEFMVWLNANVPYETRRTMTA